MLYLTPRQKGPIFPFMLTLTQLADQFPTDDACYEYLVAIRWPEEVPAPPVAPPRSTASRPGRAVGGSASPRGMEENYNFSVLVGTIFENTNIPLRTWFQAILLCAGPRRA